jgi:hypothetical protein
MIDDLFDRLAKLENAPRDAGASAAIADGLRRAPNAVYALTQTVLVQDEALKRANARIEELEDATQGERPTGSFLDSMRDAIMGPGSSRGSVPSVRPAQANTRSPWTGQPTAPLPGGAYAQPAGGGSSFLGTAAAAATGMIGGSLLMNGIRGLMGGGQQQSFGGNLADNSRSPWGSDSTSSNNDSLSRDAGINDIGKSDGSNDGNRFAGSDSDWNNASPDPDQNSGQDDGGFDGGDFDGGSDYA